MIPYIPQPHLDVAGIRFNAFGALVAAALLVGCRVFIVRARRQGLDAEFAKVFIVAVAGIGYLASHVFQALIFAPTDLWDIYSFGGIAGGLAVAWFLMRKYRLTPLDRWKHADNLAYAFSVGWIFGRAGCALAHDHIGIRSASWLAVRFPDGPRLDLGLLELLFTLGLVALFVVLDRRPRPPGLFFGLFLALYGAFRLYRDPLEAARQGPANQVFAALAAMAGIVVLAAAVRRRHGNQQKDKLMSTRKSIRDAGVRAIVAIAFTLFAAAGVAQAQSFAKAPGSPYTSAPPTGNGVAVAVGDFNNDGLLDFATADKGNGAPTITIYLQNADGSFTSPVGGQIASPGLTLAVSIAVADLDLDGNLDLVVGGANGFVVFFGDGKGKFVAGPLHTTKGSANLVVGDFNSDGIPDIVVTTTTGFELFAGKGSRQFDTGTPFTDGPAGGDVTLAAGDVHGDGNLGLVLLRAGSNTVAVELNDGEGGFTYAASGSAGLSTQGNGPKQLRLADYNGDGSLDLLVLNGDPSSDTIAVFLGDGNGGFTFKNTLDVNSCKRTPGCQGPSTVSDFTTGDFDGDGHLDLAVITPGPAPMLMILLGDGAGGFAAQVGFTFTGQNPTGIAVADLNNDGKPDLVVTTPNGAADVQVELNNMDFTLFQPSQVTFWAAAGQTTPIPIGVPNFGARIAASVSFTASQPWLSYTGGCGGKNCLVASPAGLAAGTHKAFGRDIGPANDRRFGLPLAATLEITDPSGSLAAATGSPLPTSQKPVAIAVLDFGGGLLDLAVLANNGSVDIFNGLGPDGFELGAALSPAGNPLLTPAVAIVAADFNGDGFLDLVVAGGDHAQIWIHTSVNGGQPGPIFPATGIHFLAAGDFNNDGAPDLIALAGPSLAVLLNDGFGGFHPPTVASYPTGGASPISAAVGDFNGDGNLDIAVVNEDNNTLTVFLGDGLGGFSPLPGISARGKNPFAVVAGDFNGDGNLDLAIALNTDSTVAVLLGDGQGNFTDAPGSPFPAGVMGPYQLGMADFDGDGHPDLAVVGSLSPKTANLMVLLGTGTGAFTPSGPFSAGGTIAVTSGLPTGTSRNFATGYFNGGRPGMVFADFADNNVSVLFSQKAPASIALAASPLNSVAAGQNLTLTANLQQAGPVFAMPTGSVQFQDGSTVLGSANLLNGVATFQTSSLSAGAHSLKASYTGDIRFLQGVSNSVAETVTGPAPAPAWTITKTHTGNFTQGQSGATYTITVSNTGNAPATATGGAPVEVIDFLPAGLTAVSVQGTGWLCELVIVGDFEDCVRTGSLAAGTSFPPLTLTVNVAANAPASVTNTASVSGGGAPTASASDPTTITISAPPSGPFISSILNGASFLPGFSQGSFLSIFGTHLSTTPRIWAGADFVGQNLPTQLDGVSVTIDGKPAYVSFISPNQLNVLAPADVAVGSVPVQVTFGGVASNAMNSTEAAFTPSLFMFSPLGQKYAVAVRSDGALLGPPNLLGSAVATVPARPGDVILLYGTGFGPTNPAANLGTIVSGAPPTANTVTATIGGVPATVQYAGLVFAGDYQFNILVPNVPAGDNLIVLKVGGLTTQINAFLAVQ